MKSKVKKTLPFKLLNSFIHSSYEISYIILYFQMNSNEKFRYFYLCIHLFLIM